MPRGLSLQSHLAERAHGSEKTLLTTVMGQFGLVLVLSPPARPGQNPFHTRRHGQHQTPEEPPNLGHT